MTTPKHPQIVLHLEALPVQGGLPLAVRVRSILKRLLRDYRFRCASVAGDGLDDAKPTVGPSQVTSAPPAQTAARKEGNP
jgi:hypothetical protein